MQRKNNILNSSRTGMAMIMAIAVIVVISTIMVISLTLTTETSKRTTDLYLYEQSVLYSKSAAELALLSIAQNGPCTLIPPYTLNTIYNINVNLRYVYRGIACGGANDYFAIPITTDEQNGSVLMDITVTINDPTIVSEPIRYFRRSIQKL